jgi:hypothetical protein
VILTQLASKEKERLAKWRNNGSNGALLTFNNTGRRIGILDLLDCYSALPNTRSCIGFLKSCKRIYSSSSQELANDRPHRSSQNAFPIVQTFSTTFSLCANSTACAHDSALTTIWTTHTTVGFEDLRDLTQKSHVMAGELLLGQRNVDFLLMWLER